MGVSFAGQIKPMFRTVDIQHMKPFGVLLDDYGYMSTPDNDHKNATDVYGFVAGSRQPRMPIGGPYWTQPMLDLYAQWRKDGF